MANCLQTVDLDIEQFDFFVFRKNNYSHGNDAFLFLTTHLGHVYYDTVIICTEISSCLQEAVGEILQGPKWGISCDSWRSCSRGRS
jgi:hypothetical protein